MSRGRPGRHDVRDGPEAERGYSGCGLTECARASRVRSPVRVLLTSKASPRRIVSGGRMSGRGLNNRGQPKTVVTGAVVVCMTASRAAGRWSVLLDTY